MVFSTRRILIAVLALAPVGLVSSVLWSMNAPAPAPRTTSDGSPAATTLYNASTTLERRIAELEVQRGESDPETFQAEIARIKAQIAEIQGVLSRIDVPPATEEMSEEERARRQEQLTRDTFVLLDQTLRVEARDQAWSQTAEQKIIEAFEQVGQNGRLILESADCRSTLCSVRMRALSPSDFREIDFTAPLSATFGSGIVTSQGTTAQMFLSREGAEIPRLPR
jgi:hypothetical protein